YFGNVMAVPYRLYYRVREAERENVPYRFLAEIMIDAVDLAFIEDLVDSIVEAPRARAIMTKRLFDDETCPGRPRPSRLNNHPSRETLHDGREQARCGSQVQQKISAGSVLGVDFVQ